MGSDGAHWNSVYTSKSETEVSWYQAQPLRSLDMIRAVAAGGHPSLVDIGGGTSLLVDALLADGFADLTVLDIAEAALASSHARQGERASAVTWIAADVTRWQPARTWDIWHDRAAFHFLTDRGEQEAYLAALRAATHPGSAAIVSCFALDGPERCSGLPVQRYSPEGLAERFGPRFRLETGGQDIHRTPGGNGQRFTYAVLRRT